MPSRNGCRIGMLVALAALFSSAAVIAGTTGKIAGKVLDADTKEPLIGANVLIENTVMGGSTDIDGEYYIINVPPGRYSVVVRMIGYTSQRMENINVTVDLTTKADFRLKSTVLETKETVVVTADRTKVQKDLTSSERSMGSREIDQMPVKSVEELVKLQAGVVRDASGNLHIRGGRSSEITYMVDGVQVINPLYRSSGISIDDQAIQELKAITGTFNAEYGQALSGVINIVTKKGADQFNINATAYLGDHLSFDKDVYSVMNNTQWANAMARAMNQKYPMLDYDFTRHGINSIWEANMSAMALNKPWMEKKATLSTYEPYKNRDFQLNVAGPVPGTGKRISYFLSGRYRYAPGYNIGKRYFMPWGFQSPVSDTVNTFESADNELVPLNWYEGFSTQSSVYAKISNALNLSYGIYYNRDRSYSSGDNNTKYLPDGGLYYNTDRYTQILSLSAMLSNSTFLDIKASTYQDHSKNYLYEDPYDYRYMPVQPGDFERYVFRPGSEDNVAVSPNPNDFVYWGNNSNRGNTDARYFSLNMDLTSQMSKRHLVKTGVSARVHDLAYDNYNLQFSQATYRPIIPDPSSPYHIQYHAKPQEFSAYIQDKIEFNELIINIGLRFDYFDSKGRILADPMDPQIYSPFKLDHIYKNYAEGVPDNELVEYTVTEREPFWYTKPKAKYQVSPRFGVSFPITDRDVIHFSYGHFFQNPEFRYLYANPNFWITGAGAQNLVGNADLNAERTVMYEVGLQQQMRDNIYLHVTGFYRDIRDWVGSGFPVNTYRGLTYYQYVNRDHATAKGVTLSGSYTVNEFSVNLDYTYMTAVGTSSDPQDAYNDLQNSRAPRVQMVNLDWDQQQSLNLVFNYASGGWAASLIGAMNSGLPYTPSFARGESTGSSATVGLRENSDRIPMSYSIDFRISKQMEFGFWQVQPFLNVTNLLDTRNAQSVYTDTGRPDFTLNSYLNRNRFGEIGAIEEYYTQPGMYSAPRFIQLGLRISFNHHGA